MSSQTEMAKNILPCDTSKPYAFVSYSKKDYAAVYPVVSTLQKEGYNIWIDKELTANVGENWQNVALDAISNKRCQTILFFVSEHSMLSTPVCAEITWAHSKVANRYGAVKVIPICTAQSWTPKNKGIHEWIIKDLADSAEGENDIAPAEYDILSEAQTPPELTSGPARLRYHSDLALRIFEVHFEPNGGDNETFAFVNDLETIKKNIPKEVQITDGAAAGHDSKSENSTAAANIQESGNDSSASSNKKGKYVGEYVDGRREGFGTYYYASGSRYEGQWQNGAKQGKGKFFNENGMMTYEGDYADNKRDGYGIYYYENGNRYEGEWKEDKLHGHGKSFYTDGSLKYDGNYTNGKYDGFGTYYYKDGTYYVGYWKNNTFSGEGIWYDENGIVIKEGVWEGTKLIEAKTLPVEIFCPGGTGDAGQ